VAKTARVRSDVNSRIRWRNFVDDQACDRAVKRWRDSRPQTTLELHSTYTAHVRAIRNASRQWELGMETLINFFTLRPTFTHLGLKVVWYVYLLNAVVQTYVSISSVSQALAQRGLHLELWSPNSIPLILGLVAQLLIARLLIEVAAIVISTAPTSKS
jgi:hypothetical protein